ncbi:hypothetical protein [Streptosporangium fragile]
MKTSLWARWTLVPASPGRFLLVVASYLWLPMVVGGVGQMRQ